MTNAILPTISVIIAGRGNVVGLLSEQLVALAHQDFTEPWELLIADNGITDDVAALLARFAREIPQSKIIRAGTRPGKAHAINRAAPEARSNRLVMLDCDDVVTSSYLREIARALEDHDFVGARIDSAALNPAWLQGRRQPMQADRLEPLLGDRTAVIGAAMALTGAALEKVHGFDEDMLAQEDLDLSLRLHLAGIVPVFVPTAVVRYRYRPDFRGIFRQERAYARYEALLYAKHSDALPPRRLRRTLMAWLDVVVAATGVSTRTGRAQFATNLGAAFGRAEGSLRYGIRHL